MTDLYHLPPKPRARLENWSRCGERLVGNVYDHPDAGKPGQEWRGIDDGNFITTSPVKRMDEEVGWAETANTYYELGMRRQ